MGTFPNDTAAYIVGIVVGGFIGILLVFAVGVCIYKQRRIDDQMKAIESEVDDLRQEAGQSRHRQSSEPTAPTA
jgi:uncharacterized membrane-anchored protein YhcB (DUF1043 family)